MKMKRFMTDDQFSDSQARGESLGR